MSYAELNVTSNFTFLTGASHPDARNLTLLLMVLFGNVHALSSRSEARSLFKIPAFSNPFLAVAVPGALLMHLTAMHVPGLNSVLDIHPVSLTSFFALVGVALIFFVVEEAHKVVIRRWRHREQEEAKQSQAIAQT